MSPEEQERKLKWISQLQPEEIVGWEGVMRVFRDPFPGEIAALESRKKALGMSKSQPKRRRK